MPKGGKPGPRKLNKHPLDGVVAPNYGKLVTNDLEAFEFFYKTRRYSEVARKFQVSPTAVHKHADKLNWIDRLAKRMEKVEEQITEKLSDRLARDAHRSYGIMSLVEVNALNKLKSVNLQAGQSIKSHELSMTASAVETAVKTKRLLAGESTETHEVTFKDLIQKVTERRRKLSQENQPPVLQNE